MTRSHQRPATGIQLDGLTSVDDALACSHKEKGSETKDVKVFGRHAGGAPWWYGGRPIDLLLIGSLSATQCHVVSRSVTQCHAVT